MIDLSAIFQDINRAHFDGLLPECDLAWNGRLRIVAGRFTPRRRFPNDLRFGLRPALIEVASYLRSEPSAEELVRDTIGHEMIHFWLWVRGRPYGHTAEFLKKMRLMGVSRYNQAPKQRPYKFLYGCPSCHREYPSRRRLRSLACRPCCDQFNRGRFDARFRLVFLKEHTSHSEVRPT